MPIICSARSLCAPASCLPACRHSPLPHCKAIRVALKLYISNYFSVDVCVCVCQQLFAKCDMSTPIYYWHIYYICIYIYICIAKTSICSYLHKTFSVFVFVFKLSPTILVWNYCCSFGLATPSTHFCRYLWCLLIVFMNFAGKSDKQTDCQQQDTIVNVT